MSEKPLFEALKQIDARLKKIEKSLNVVVALLKLEEQIVVRRSACNCLAPDLSRVTGRHETRCPAGGR